MQTRPRPAALAQAFLLATVAVLLASTPSPAGAADADAERRKVVCAPELAQITQLTQALEACDSSARELRAREQACRAQSAADADRIGSCRASLRKLESSRDALCRAVGDFGRSIAEGDPPTANLEGCLPAPRQEQIAAELGAWRRIQPQLRALLQFARGERAALPPGARPGPLPVEQVVAELVASDPGRPPVLYRRLLASALERIAPQFWDQLRGRGPAAVDAWFASRARLDPELVAQAHAIAGTSQGPPGPAGPPLAAALKFVQTYVEVAGCARLSPGARDCVRARQLQELLESSGPLVVERRIEGIWASDCRTITPGTVLGWLQDFPSSQQPVDEAQWAHVTENGFTKLETCFLGAENETRSTVAWVRRKLPSPNVLTGPALARLSRIRQRLSEDSDEELCGRAVRAVQRMSQPTACELPPAVLDALTGWAQRESAPQRPPASRALNACTELLHALWQGNPAFIPASFAGPPSAGEVVDADEGFVTTPMSRLRRLCDERRGGEAFPGNLRVVAELAPAFGERPEASPWRLERARGAPLEQVRFDAAARPAKWLANVLARATPCAALGLPPDRCAACGTARETASFDCDLLRRLDRRWGRWQRILWLSLSGALGAALLLAWAGRMWSAWRRFGSWSTLLRGHLESVAIRTSHDRSWWLVPSRLQDVTIELPREPAWERWGRRAIVHRGVGGPRVLDRDVNLAATRARAAGVDLTVLAHDDGASPDLGAVRALLEWAARGTGRAVHVLPLSVSRLQWLRSADDLLEVVEQSSVRGNPFELRGRVTSAGQFFDRERLVSGLLAEVQSGNWVFVGGLRRFGKSSLALEVGRRLPGPSAYVDLAAFHHEVASAGGEAEAADAILRYASIRLHESAAARLGAGAALPAPLPASGPLAVAEVTEWYRAFARACSRGPGHRAEPMLLVLDELEQAMGVEPERLPRAVEVLSILLGRLRGALWDPAVGGSRAGVLLCGAMHPVLWAPLPSLAGQSVMGAFQTVFVPRLPDEAAWAMMRGLGARQGIRFTEPALSLIVEQGQGVPLLIRRLASSVLELYDPERARQGGLGAVEIGIEGASAAVRREEEEGSPLRVWVESEIADPRNVAGALLRRLASAGRMTTAELRTVALAELRGQFVATGIDRLLSADEQVRRASEAAAVMVRLMGETGLLVPEGDPTSPEAYLLPDGLLRRILGGRPAEPLSASPTARPAP